MREYEYVSGDCSLKYIIDSGQAHVTGWQGRGWLARVPGQIEGIPVVSVGRKAFLSRKNLREIQLPEGLRGIGDWAFAYCDNLERVTIPARCSQIGKALFLDCGRLSCVTGICEGSGEAGPREAWHPESGRLLAAAVTQLEAYYLLEPGAVGSPEWLRKWDARLEAVMRAQDQEGYSRQVLCGEEDYGSTDLEAFLRARRQKKVRLAMLRLLCGEGLRAEMRSYLEEYIRSHTGGCDSEESWQVVLEEGELHPEYARLFLDLGCATKDNIGYMIGQMGEDQPQLRAAFLRYRQESQEPEDFFAGLAL